MAAAAAGAFLAAGHAARAQVLALDGCPGVSDLLSVAPSQDIHLDVFAYVPGALGERLRRCRDRIGQSWLDPVEEGRRQAMGLMFEWAGAFSCAITEYASAPSTLARPLGGPRANYLREATRLEALSGSYEAEADLRSSEPLEHFRALQLLVKIQSRWNQSSETDRAELQRLDAGGDPNAAIALATLAFAARRGSNDVDRALVLLAKATRTGSVRAPMLGAQYAAIAAGSAAWDARRRHYERQARQFLTIAAYRGSVEALGMLKDLPHDDAGVDGAAAAAYWDATHRGITRDLYEIRNACR
jgi:hypothetical protein